ncbi:MAG: hypothetical protein GY694_16815 [Gammaproteobacteria bacterium]|nr:hypothetical protein [Gammaproteobacteria bacterium]
MSKVKKSHSEPRGEYKVVFKGKLLPGFDKARVVANIVQLTKLPPEKIEKKFFSGKVVIIRRAHDKPHAQKLQQLFTKAGLEVFILIDETQKKLSEPKPQSSKKQKKIAVKKLKKAAKKYYKGIMAATLWGVFLVFGFNLWNTYSVTVEVPDEVVGIEASLANKPLLFITHINLDRFKSRQRYFINSSGGFPGEQSELFQTLKQSGVDPLSSIDQVFSTAYFENAKLISQTVLLGQFSVEKMKQFFLKNYNGQLITDSGFARLRISQIDEQTCKKNPLMEISIEPERILMSTDGYLSDLHQILKQEPGHAIDLANWKEYRSDKLVSIGFFDPKSLTAQKSAIKTKSAGLPMLMAEGLIKKNQSINSLYAGVGLQLLPPAGVLDITINSTNQAWLDKVQGQLLTHIENMKTQSLGLHHLQSLLGKVTLQKNVITDLKESSESQVGQLSVNVILDSEFKESFELSIYELSEKFLSTALGTTAKGMQIPSNATSVEKIDAQPQKYWSQYEPSKLKPFNETLDQFFKPVWIEGPFALSIDELLLASDSLGDQVLLKLRGKAQNIDNVGSSQAKIVVTAANDEQGKNLLAKAKCGESMSQEAFFTRFVGSRTAYIDGQPVHYNEMDVQQQVRLRKGVKFSSLKSLQGQIELNLATQTKTKEVIKTDKNTVIAEYNTRLLFSPSAPNSLSFAMSGDIEKVLAVRALNKNKDYLARVSSSSMGSFFDLGSGSGTSKSVTHQYQGNIAFIEVVYATKSEKVSYPFNLSKFPPYPSENAWKYNLEFAKLSSTKSWNEQYQDLEPLNIEETANQSWYGDRQASWHDGPFNIGLYGLKTNKHFATSGTLLIKTPIVEELKNNLSAVEIYIRYPEPDEDGVMGRSYFCPMKSQGYYMNGDFIQDKDKLYMDGQLAFRIPYKKEDKPLSQLNGDIVVHLPVSKHSSVFSDLTIGAVWEDEGVSVKLIRLGSDVMELEVHGQRDQLLQITLVDSNKQRISTTDIKRALPGQAKAGNIIVNYHGVPVKAFLTVSEGQQTQRYPFNLKINKK